MILGKIIDSKKRQLEQEMKEISIDGWKERIKRPGMHSVQDFYKAITQQDKLSIIAEVKKASPSKGIIREDFDPLQIAQEYYASEVQAISILTEKQFFQGSEEYLVKIRQSLPIPLLRKDFVIDLWQVYQSRFLGADAILLIVAALDDEKLKKFQIVAGILKMSCLVEVHDRNELERALDSGANIIGINNRNLETFEVDIKTTETLMNHIPLGKAVVSESGICSREDMQYLKSLGVNAVLIGEAFMRSNNIRDKINNLRDI